MRKFSKLVDEIGNSFSVPVTKLIQPTDIKVFRLGEYVMPLKKLTLDLSEYLIDSAGDMYSLNDDTYFTKYGTRLKLLSNGVSVNSFRCKSGRKVTISRSKLIASMRKGKFEQTSFDELPVVKDKIETKNFSAQG